jgi:hypothetical protein
LSEDEAAKLWSRIQDQLAKDEARLRAIQNADGSWGFDPGKSSDDGKTWKTDGQFDPAPTALALIALRALGRNTDDRVVARGVKALLKMQDPYGRWNKSAQTGFVTTAYALHALSRLYPQTSTKPARAEFTAKRLESLPEAVARVRALSHTDDPALIDLMIQATTHPSPWVRKWGAMALGGVHREQGVPALIRLMGDPVKMVRDAAAWAMKQTLLDDVGFAATFTAFERGDDLTRESVLKALGMRADTVMTHARFDRRRLERLLDAALNDDPHPGVRAWAAKAAVVGLESADARFHPTVLGQKVTRGRVERPGRKLFPLPITCAVHSKRPQGQRQRRTPVQRIVRSFPHFGATPR